MSYLSRHRPICAVLQEIRELTKDPEIIKLIDEAISYAQSMSAKLVEYRIKEEKQDANPNS